MQTIRHRAFALLSLVMAFAAAGCSERNTALSPTAPSSSAGASTFEPVRTEEPDNQTQDKTTFTTLDHNNNGNSNSNSGNSGSSGNSHANSGKDTDQSKADDREGAAGKGKPEQGSRRALSGFVTAVNATSLTVRGVVVTAAPGAVIRHGNQPLLLSSIVVGDHVQARGRMGADALSASEIKVERTRGHADDGEGTDEDRSEVEGAVSDMVGTTGCPVLTFKVGTTTVTTSAATVFDGVLCTALANGALVEVKGATQADGSILASKVEQD